MLTVQNKEGVTLAFLNNLLEAKIHEVINGEYILTFTAAVDPLKTPVLYDENNIVVCDNDYFRVRVIEEIHSEDDEVTVAIECEHMSYELIDNIMSNFSYSYKTAAEVIPQCLLGTDYTLRYCGVTTKTDINYTQECNSREILVAIANDWKGELKFFRNYVDLLPRRGANRGTGFIFGKSLKGIKRTIDRATRTTSYEVSIIEGTEIDELGYYELGDTVRIMDERLNIDYECRIVELEKDLLTGLNSKVVLGDSIKDMRSSFKNSSEYAKDYADKVGESSKSYTDKVGTACNTHASDLYDGLRRECMADWDKLSSITNELGNVISGKLQGEISLLTNNIKNSTGTFEQRDNGLYWQDQPTKAASTFATMWTAQGIMFARSKNSAGDWNWESALSAEGLVATKVLASALKGLTVESVTTTSSIMNAGTIKGCSIEGGNIKIGTTDANGVFTGFVVESSGNIKGYYEGKQSYSLVHASEGRLRLINPHSSAEIFLNSANGWIAGSPKAVLANGTPAQNVNGIIYNNRIEVDPNGITLYTYTGSGTNTGTVTVVGDLNVRGDIQCFKMTQTS